MAFLTIQEFIPEGTVVGPLSAGNHCSDTVAIAIAFDSETTEYTSTVYDVLDMSNLTLTERRQLVQHL